MHVGAGFFGTFTSHLDARTKFVSTSLFRVIAQSPALSGAFSTVLVLSTCIIAACQHVPPAPIDPAENANRLLERSLDDPVVAVAFERYGLRIPESGEWSVDQLTVAAWSLRTDIAVAYADLEVARAATRFSGQRQNPSIATTFERVTNASSGEKPWVAGASVGLVFETADKRDIRVQRGLAEEDALEWQLAETLWTARAELGAALIAQSFAARTLELDDEELRLRREYLDWIDTRLQFGAAAMPDRRAASEAVSGLEGQRELDRAALDSATADIAAAVGIANDALPAIASISTSADDLPDFGPQDLLAARESALSNRLDVQRSLAEYMVAEQDLRAALASQYPDIVLGPGYLKDQADRKFTLNLDLPAIVSRRSEAAIDNAIAARAAAASRFDDVQATAIAEINKSYARYGAIRAALSASQSAEREAIAAVQLMRQRIDAGAANRGELVGAEIDLIVRRRNTLDTLHALAEALATLQNGIQQPLYPPSLLPVGIPREPVQ